ncbi:DNA-binding domain-containing protein [Variovorax sp. LjRoot290]|uniref:HvfC/BufC N-terminal domain-containing protein n=1 Tax=unclassified Variovorax TaxID=663243 RepID=UPI003ECE9C4A
MLALPDIQARVMDALLLRGGAAATALVRPTEPLSARQRLQVYRNNMFESLIAALGAVYPVVARLVGTGFFRHATKACISAHPSRSSNLQDFGGEFPGFLRAYPPAADLPYLPDVAALEWALHRAYHEAELPALALERLAQVPAAEQAGLRLRLQPSARFVASRYPVLRIWQANQPEALDDGSTISLDEGGVNLLVVQHALEIEFRLLSLAESRWLCALADEASLADATRRALDADPAFDLMAVLARHLGRGLFTEVSA